MNSKNLEELYSKTFETPSYLFLSVFIALIIFLSYLINGMVRYAYMTFSSFTILLILRRFLKIKFDLRRILFFVFIILLFSFALDVLSFILKHRFSMAQIMIAFLAFLIIYFKSESSEYRSLAGALILSIAIYYPFDKTCLLALMGLALGFLYLKYMDRDVRGFNIKRYFKAFLLSWLTNNANYFETELKRNCKKFMGWVKCLKIDDVKLVSTSFHPGPMRNIGGAKLVREVLSLNNTIFLHSPTGHDMNPVSGDDVRKIVKSVKCEGIRLRAMRPFDVMGRKFILRVFPFDKMRLMFLIGKDGIEDLPYELNGYAESFGNVLLVDSHNAFNPDFEPDVEEIKELIRRGFEVKTEPCDLRYYFERERIETGTICGNVAVLVLDYGVERHAILMIDGNNIELGFRNEIEEFGRKKGFKITVISTDNHLKTAINVKRCYNPVGSDKKDRVVLGFLNRIFDRIKNGNLEKCRNITFSKNCVEVCVVGKEFCEFVNKVDEFGINAFRIFKITMISSAALSILLA